MRIYLFYSKNNIIRVTDVYSLKDEILKIIISEFDVFNVINDSDIVVEYVQKIQNEVDIALILVPECSSKRMINEKTQDKMNNIKRAIRELFNNFKKSTYLDLSICTRIDPNFKPVIKRNTRKLSEQDVQNYNNTNEKSEIDYENRAKQYVPVDPSYSFDRVILPQNVIDKLEEALSILDYERKIFDEWGLYEIQPHPSASLSFFGPSGTGKTMAAEAVAQKLGKKILKVSYADVESKYHGEGPKMVKAIFLAAEKSDAVLFFDEADSLLSKRLTNVSQGSEQAINSMRSQLLICLEEFRGIVIFATNLIINYDNAFLTRLISVEFENPDNKTRKKIWDVHIRPINDGKEHRLNIPLSSDVNTSELADKYIFAGREIRNAVISACVSAAKAGKEVVCQSDFVKACDRIVKEKESIASASDHTLSDNGSAALKKALINNVKMQEQPKEASLVGAE